MLRPLAPLVGWLLLLCACGRQPRHSPAPLPLLSPQTSNTTALLQAVSVVDERTVWASGHDGTWVVSADGGATWTAGTVAGADTLQFRDLHAISRDTAWLMSAGPGSASRIYRTNNGGRSWTTQQVNRHPEGFYDCFAFWSPTRAIVFSDQVGGRTLLLETRDGESWSEVSPSRVPQPVGKEAGFAASGTCVTTHGDRLGWIATGAGSVGRVLRTSDGGETWAAAATPVAAGPSAGLTAVAFRDAKHGVALGGDVAQPGGTGDNVAVTDDGGRTWRKAAWPPFPGAVFGAVYATGVEPATLVAVGPGGMALSRDDARSWVLADTLAYWSVGFGGGSVGWAVGPAGRMTRIELGPSQSR
ncbi:MAG: hypothetical protein H0T44_06540 [Gemmatimonadales bacterium]|nr:hypothetical protein [Gemmatimonadales bacterium]